MENGDLISRSALLESLIHCDGLGRKSLEAVIKHINEQPTAYNVEKVVEELRKHHEEEMVTRNPIISLDSAISIVRNGGEE